MPFLKQSIMCFFYRVLQNVRVIGISYLCSNPFALIIPAEQVVQRSGSEVHIPCLMSANENKAELVEVQWSKDGVDIVQWQKETDEARAQAQAQDVSCATIFLNLQLLRPRSIDL